jgi:hypothetical protein
MGGLNPSAPATQAEANAWALGIINSGNYTTQIKPLLANLIGSANTQKNLEAIGITGDPPFEGRRLPP